MKARLANILAIALFAGIVVVGPAPPALALGFGEIDGSVDSFGPVLDAFNEISDGADAWSADQTASALDGNVTADADQTYVETYDEGDLVSVDLSGQVNASVKGDAIRHRAQAATSYSLGFSVTTETPFTATGQVSAAQAGIPPDVTAAGATVELEGVFEASVSGPGGEGIGTNGTLQPGFYSLSASADVGVGSPPVGETASASFQVTIVLGDSPCDNVFTEGPDTITGTAGDDLLCGGGGNDTIDGGGGNDIIEGGAGNDTISGGGGDDTIEAGNGADTIFGDDGGDVLEGQEGRDTIHGGDGTDTIRGGPGDDGDRPGEPHLTRALCGGPGPDTIEGGGGIDSLYGFDCLAEPPIPGSEDDDADALSGGEGNDFLSDLIGGGENVMNGDEGDDTILGGVDADLIGGGSGNDTIDAGDGNDVVVEGGRGDDLIEGGFGDDRLRGGRGSDKLRGQRGRDTLLGNRRKDVLNGGAGNDVLNACDGVLDVVIGGPGSNDTATVDQGVDDVRASTEVVNRC